MKNRKNHLILTLGLLLSAYWSNAQETGKQADPTLYNTLDMVLVIGAVTLILGVGLVLLQALQSITEAKRLEVLQAQGVDVLRQFDLEEGPDFFSRLYKRMTNVVPVEKEKDIMLDHDYDGIRELDNSLPPWWVWMFYLTIGFGFFYIGYYHFSDNAGGQLDWYEQEMEEGEKIKLAYLRAQADLVNEENVEPLVDEDALIAGEVIFKNSCAACHGQLGEGGVGPNMTDEYWIHGGDIKSIFKTVKYGVPEKGMIAWSTQMGAGDMHKVSSYILTLVGTNPPNQKEPQGEKYVPSEQEDDPVESNDTAGDELGMN